MKNSTINYDAINYKQLYLEKFKKLPNIYYISTLVAVIAVGVLDLLVSTGFLSWAYGGLFSFLVGTEDYISGILAMIIWVVIAFGAAYLVRHLSAIGLSQKIVVADTLLDIQKGHPTYSTMPNMKTNAPSQKSTTQASLERIAKLKDQGVLTEEEAAKMRADVLAGN